MFAQDAFNQTSGVIDAIIKIVFIVVPIVGVLFFIRSFRKGLKGEDKPGPSGTDYKDLY